MIFNLCNKTTDKETRGDKRMKTIKLLVPLLLTGTLLIACSEEEKEPKEETPSEMNVKAEEKKTDTTKSEEQKTEDKGAYLYENDAFRIETVDVQEDGKKIIVSGLANVYEATISYSVEDGHEVFDTGFVTASSAEWGTFELIVQLKDGSQPANGSYYVILYSESMADGSWMHQLEIPVEIK